MFINGWEEHTNARPVIVTLGTDLVLIVIIRNFPLNLFDFVHAVHYIENIPLKIV